MTECLPLGYCQRAICTRGCYLRFTFWHDSITLNNFTSIIIAVCNFQKFMHLKARHPWNQTAIQMKCLLNVVLDFILQVSLSKGGSMTHQGSTQIPYLLISSLLPMQSLSHADSMVGDLVPCFSDCKCLIKLVQSVSIKISMVACLVPDPFSIVIELEASHIKYW